jgi:anti-anti-sigma factor
MAEFEATTSDGNNEYTKVVHIKGELDEVTVEKLKVQIDPLLEAGNVLQIIFDLTNLEFINSKGIGYLVSVHTHLAKDSRTMVLAGASEPVMDVISLVGLTNIIPFHATLEEALGSKS